MFLIVLFQPSSSLEVLVLQKQLRYLERMGATGVHSQECLKEEQDIPSLVSSLVEVMALKMTLEMADHVGHSQMACG